MPRYHYQALNNAGVSLEGMLRADSERDAARQLERRGLSVIEVRSGEGGKGSSRHGRMRHGDVILALQELATMLTSGVSIADAVGSQALGAQPVDCGFHLAIVLHQRFFAFHHASAGALAQFFNCGCCDFHGVFLKYQ